jgi:hypothetical protein
MRNSSTIEFIGLWESLNNSSFKPIEFERFKNESGNNYFVLSPQRWIETTKAIGIISKSGRYGGTFAHKDIAFEFATWISPEFKLYLITTFVSFRDYLFMFKKSNWDLNTYKTLLVEDIALPYLDNPMAALTQRTNRP